MIERIQIRNFQKHSKLRVAFDEKITTIVGPSDAGKSSILRAIRWVAFNRPLGDGFIRHGEEACSVKLWVDGRKVERQKTKGKNVYSIDGKMLSAVGTDVPEEIQRLLNLTSENFQGQHDAPFWFSLTAGEVAKRLNVIVDLEVIDRSATWLASRLRKARTEQEVAERRLQAAVEEQQRLEFVPELAKDFGAVKQSWMAAKVTTEKRDQLRRALEIAVQTSQRAGTLGKAAEQGQVAGEAVSVLEGTYDTWKQLAGIVAVATVTKIKVERLNAEVAEAEAELNEKTGGVCPVCGGAMK
jgi:exonuclease SbcC